MPICSVRQGSAAAGLSGYELSTVGHRVKASSCLNGAAEQLERTCVTVALPRRTLDDAIAAGKIRESEKLRLAMNPAELCLDV